MPPRADAATLNVQPRQRRTVYLRLAESPAGRSVKHLLEELDIPESELRETLRKLDAAGLARRTKGMWLAVPLEACDPGHLAPQTAPESQLPT
jgi:predicted ArsR family transcriptional regulator